jgi:dynein heavy chain
MALPPILKKFSWTRAAPYKEEKYFRGVSDSIGNNFSPSAMDLNIKEVSKRAFYQSEN